MYVVLCIACVIVRYFTISDFLNRYYSNILYVIVV